MARILVTGADGFIGKHLVRFLIDKHEVFTPMGVINPFSLLEFPDEIDYIYHLAAQTSVQESIKNPLADAKNNIAVTINMLEYAREVDAHFIYTNTLASNKSPYGMSKNVGADYVDLYRNLYGLRTSVFNLANVYGPGCHGLVAETIKALKNNSPITINNDGESQRFYIHVDDVVEHLVSKLVFLRTNLVSDVRYSTWEVIKEISNFSNEPISIRWNKELVAEDYSVEYNKKWPVSICPTKLIDGLRATWNDWDSYESN